MPTDYIRRFDGKNYAHGNSRKKYDELINIYTREYLDSTANPELNIFLNYNPYSVPFLGNEK